MCISRIGAHEPVPRRVAHNLLRPEMGELLGGLDVGHVLHVALGEDDVDLLEGAPRRLGIEEPDDGQEAGVAGGEEEVGGPANAGDHDGDDHDDDEVEEPVRAGAHGVGLRARLDRVHLGRVEPREGQPGGAEGGDVEEEANDGALGDLLLAVVVVARDEASEGDGHAEHLPCRAVEEETAATDALDEEPGGGGGEGVDYHVDAADEEAHVPGQADAF